MVKTDVIFEVRIFRALQLRQNDRSEEFMSTTFVENFMQNIFGDLTFFSKVHISRENRKKVMSGSHFDPFHKREPSWEQWVFLGILGLMFLNSPPPISIFPIL